MRAYFFRATVNYDETGYYRYLSSISEQSPHNEPHNEPLDAASEQNSFNEPLDAALLSEIINLGLFSFSIICGKLYEPAFVFLYPRILGLIGLIVFDTHDLASTTCHSRVDFNLRVDFQVKNAFLFRETLAFIENDEEASDEAKFVALELRSALDRFCVRMYRLRTAQNRRLTQDGERSESQAPFFEL